jgi:hypothetical protein
MIGKAISMQSASMALRIGSKTGNLIGVQDRKK